MERPRATLSVTTVSWQLIGILSAGLVFRLALLLVHGSQRDLETNERWSRLLVSSGTAGFYAHVTSGSHISVDVAPGFALILLFVVRIYDSIPGPFHGAIVLGALLRVPGILADLGAAALCYSIVIRYAARSQAIFAAGLAAFAPWTWPLSAIAGSYDSICVLFVLLALDCTLDENYVPAWLAIAAGSLVGPLPVALAPLVFVAQARDEGSPVRLAIGPLLGIGIAYVAALPFVPAPWPFPVFVWLAHVYATVQGPPMTSWDAPNLWYALVQPMADTHRAIGMSLRIYGWLAFAAVEVFVLGVMLRRTFESKSRLRSTRVLVSAWFATMLAAFALTTRMHGVDLAYALAITPTMWAMGTWERHVTIALTITFCAGTLLSLAVWHDSAPAIAMLRFVAIANVTILGYTTVRFAVRKQHVTEDWGAVHIP